MRVTTPRVKTRQRLKTVKQVTPTPGHNPYGDQDQRTAYDDRDRRHFEHLAALLEKHHITVAQVLQHYPAFVRRRDVPRFLAHYELFKRIEKLPGSIVELGVYRGSGMMTWHHFLESFCPGDRNRRVYGFDHFQGYSERDAREKHLQSWVDHVLGNMQSNEELLRELLKIQNNDNLLPGVERSHLIAGDVCNTVPQFVQDNPGLRLSLLYFDVGMYEPTVTGLEHLYPLVVSGGVVAFNGYGMKPWIGETQALEEYCARVGVKPRLEKFPFSTLPHGYFIKD